MFCSHFFSLSPLFFRWSVNHQRVADGYFSILFTVNTVVEINKRRDGKTGKGLIRMRQNLVQDLLPSCWETEVSHLGCSCEFVICECHGQGWQRETARPPWLATLANGAGHVEQSWHEFRVGDFQNPSLRFRLSSPNLLHKNMRRTLQGQVRGQSSPASSCFIR